MLEHPFLMDGKPFPLPDQGVEMSFEDLDSAQSGRDESGFMHRTVVRYKVGVWNFSYSHLTRQEYAYMRAILPETGSFTFTYPDPESGELRDTTGYLSRYGILWQCARTGQYRNFKFSIIEC